MTAASAANDDAAGVTAREGRQQQDRRQRAPEGRQSTPAGRAVPEDARAVA
jgi:hypothetical protein